jgi:hypothetical protein
MRKTLVLMIGATLAASSAVASPDTDALKATGLAGKWAVDCSKPASATNIHSAWTETADGHVVLTTDTDKKDANPSTLLELKQMPDNRVLYTVKADSDEIDVVLKMEKNRYRLWSSSLGGLAAGYAGTDDVYVKDGKILANGEQTPWYEKCEK